MAQKDQHNRLILSHLGNIFTAVHGGHLAPNGRKRVDGIFRHKLF
jgi:hypothetical protein